MRTRLDGAEALPRIREAIPRVKFIDELNYAHDLFETAPPALVKQVGAFLSGRG
jgi:hypothetical protein